MVHFLSIFIQIYIKWEKTKIRFTRMAATGGGNKIKFTLMEAFWFPFYKFGKQKKRFFWCFLRASFPPLYFTF